MQSMIDDTYSLIKDYVAKDPTAFYSVDEFETGVDALRSFCSLRSESVTTQLETGETTENTKAVDASDLTLSDMGSMNDGNAGFGGGGPAQPGAANQANGEVQSTPNAQTSAQAMATPTKLSQQVGDAAALPMARQTPMLQPRHRPMRPLTVHQLRLMAISLLMPMVQVRTMAPPQVVA